MSSNCRHPQIYDMVEGANPGIRTRSCKSGRFGVVVTRKVETARVMGGGARRVWEGFHPRIESGSERRLGMERDAIEKVDSCPRNPGLGNEAAFPERSWCIVQVVDDVVEDLWWEEGRHRGFRQNVPVGATANFKLQVALPGAPLYAFLSQPRSPRAQTQHQPASSNSRAPECYRRMELPTTRPEIYSLRWPFPSTRSYSSLPLRLSFFDSA